MTFAPTAIRLALAALLAAAGVFLLGAGAAPSQAEAATCKHVNKKVQKLTQKRARNAVRCAINNRRTNHGRDKLRFDGRLNTAARRHSRTMKNKGCFSHQCSGEGSLLTRLTNVGYITGGLSAWAYGENIAYGVGRRGTPKKIVNAWMKSSGHRANNLSRTFEEIGVGFSKDGRRGYFTADFGMRRG